jgi:hypothetical protein
MLLLSKMISTRTCVRLLRHLGIALIFAPEPFTTPLGVAFILVARHLSRRLETNRDERLRAMIHYYLDHSSILSHDADSKSGAPGPLQRHGLIGERPLLGQITGSRSLEANSSVRNVRRGLQEGRANRSTDAASLSLRCRYADGLSDTSNRTQKVIHHTIDMEWLSRRYESANGAVAHYDWTTTSGSVDGVTHHSINMGLLPQHYETGSVGQAKAKSHNINTAQLRQRYGSATTHRTVHRALQDNNRYYDMLSRRSVIGGY